MKDMVELEAAQSKALNMIKEMKQLPYEERLKRLGLCLRSRRMRGCTHKIYRIKGDRRNKYETDFMFSLFVCLGFFKPKSHTTRTRRPLMKLAS